MNIQGMFDALSAQWRKDRSRYHLTLGRLIDDLEAAEPTAVVVIDNGSHPDKPHSYRGYYSDLAFAPSDTTVTVADFLTKCRSALGSTFEGYKGGDFLMEEDTPLWSAPYGMTGRAMMATMVRDGVFMIATKDVD